MNNFKLNYSLSKKEFLLIVVLAAVAIIALYVNYLFVPQFTSLSLSHQQYKAQEAQLDSLKAEYANLDTYIEQDAKLTEDLKQLRKVVPEYYSEEEIISSLDALSSASGLKILGLTFGKIAAEPKEAFLANLKLSSASGGSEGQKDSTAETEGSSSIKSQRISINYSGSYQTLADFLSAFESDTRQVYFRNIALTRNAENSIAGTLTMLAFSLPAETEPDVILPYPGYEYDSPAASGKADPFSAFFGYETLGTASVSTYDVPDFYIILNTYDDNSNKILLGKYPVSDAQITSDKNEATSASLTLTQSGNNYTYSYTLGEKSYSGSAAIAQGDSGLAINVLSRARKSSLDKVGISLNVTNNTSLPLTINVKNDDTGKPRFSIGSTSGNVQVVR